MQAHIHFGVTLAQLGDGVRQHIARLGVGGGDRQGAAVLVAVMFAYAFEVAHFAHDDFYAFENREPWLGDAFEAFAMAAKNLNAEFLF